jgi:hypothetical protein
MKNKENDLLHERFFKKKIKLCPKSYCSTLFWNVEAFFFEIIIVEM